MLKVFAFKRGVLTNLASIAPGTGLGFGPRHLDFHPQLNPNESEVGAVCGTKILRHCSVLHRTRVQSPAPGIPPSITCHPNQSHSSFSRLLSSCRITIRPDFVSLARNAVSCGSRWI